MGYFLLRKRGVRFLTLYRAGVKINRDGTDL